MRIRKVRVLALGVSVLALAPVAAADWVEAGDAGNAPGTAQVIDTGGALTSISGSIGFQHDTDLYRFAVTDFTLFSATNNALSGVADMQLFLFDSAGLGIAMNDDFGGGATPGTLPVGAFYAVLAPGEYLLAVNRWNVNAESAGGDIFGEGVGVQAPVGPGGASPLTGFSATDFYTGVSEYRIDMTASNQVTLIPLPPAAWAGLAGLGLVAGVQRARRRD